MKKLAVYFVLCLLLGSLAATPANADRLECVWGDYYFTVKRDDSEYTASIIGYRGSAKNLVIPDEIQGLKVTEIENLAFSECDSLRTVVIPNSIHHIGQWAFMLCDNLREVTLAEGFRKIGQYAFADCYALRVVNIPQSVSVIDDGAFIGCERLQTITIPDKVDYLGQAAFFGCESLVDIKLPEHLTELSAQLFEGCKALKHIDLPSGLKTIGIRTFLGCTALEEIALPDSLKKIDMHAFADCKTLKKVIIPDHVEEIGCQAFLDCTSLKSVRIPASVKMIREEAFDGCSKQLVMNLETSSYAERYCLENGLKYVTGEASGTAGNNGLTREQEENTSAEDVYTVIDWNTPAATVVSAGRTNPLKGTCIDPQMFGKVLRVKDQVGGWFYFIAPQDGDYSFSVLAPNLNRSSFSIEVYRNASGSNQKICTLKYAKSNAVQTQTIKGIKAGTRICWWDNDNSGRGYTLQSPFSLMITCQGSTDR